MIVFGYIVDERVVLIVLSIFTLMVLLLSISTMNVVSGLAVRRTDDLRIFIDEEEQGGGGQWPTNVHLRETASSSFSS